MRRATKLNIHLDCTALHCLDLDGVYRCGAAEVPAFHRGKRAHRPQVAIDRLLVRRSRLDLNCQKFANRAKWMDWREVVMRNFPEWARPWLANQSRQVSHGLNLVLELDPTPNRLPLLLWDIVLAQDKIKQALEDLSFVHYARFVPSWDGQALMVTTEFDGPLDPYVLDFVIALGEVFDTLLSYVKTRPTMPVREHPEEFLAWVRQWNRVPYYLRTDLTLFPEGFDYPLYSAYPSKTVTDIVGKRTNLPRPSLDAPAAEVDPTDVQGNILRGYKANHASYLFFRIDDPALARNWLAQDLPNAATPWLGVASASHWPGDKAPAVLTQVAFTHQGLRALLAPARQPELQTFPTAFREGATQRAEANFDRGSSGPDHWLFGKPAGEPEHVVLFLYTKESGTETSAYETAVRVLEQGAAKGLRHLRTLRGDSRGGYEPFGFRDGISEPRVSGQYTSAEPAFQPAASPGEFLLHQDYDSVYGGTSLGNMPQALAGNGTFGVLRLLEQDVAGFKAATEQEAKRLGVDKDRLRAKLMGRRYDGTPLALEPAAPDPSGPLDAFDYAPSWEFPDLENDHEGLRCPVGAHIRRANPRTARVAGQRHARRLLRRGMASRWQEGSVEKEGLMGLFLGANIEQQFEFIQREWLQGDLAATGIRGTTCPIAAIRSASTEFRFVEPDAAGLPRTLVANIPPLVTTRGCMYLFFPGLKALRALDHAESPVAIAGTTLGAAVGNIIGGAQVVAGAAQTALAAAGQVSNQLIGGISALVGSVAGGFAQAHATATNAADHLPGLPAFPLLSDRDLSYLGNNALRDWVLQPALGNLLDGQWPEFIQALIEREFDSPWVKDLVASLLPPAVDVSPPPDLNQGRINLSDPRFVANPFETLQELRATGKRMVWVSEQKAYWVLDHAGCQELLGRHTDFVQTQSRTPYRGIVTLDRPRHEVVRNALDEAFRAALTALEPKIDAIVQRASSKLLDQRHLMHFDYMRSFAHPVARAVIWDLLGIGDAAQRRACDTLAHTMTLNYGRTARPGAIEGLVLADAGLRLAARLALSLADAWRYSFLPGSPYKGTLIGELAGRMAPGVPLPGRPLKFIETLLTLMQTVLASQSPHMLLCSAALHLLLPDARPGAKNVTPWSQLAAMATNRPAFDKALRLSLDETRRYQPPLALIERYAHGAQTICGVQVPDGCPVFAMVGSGNRDEKVFGSQPEHFYLDRLEATNHLSLGHGIHECAGQYVQQRVVRAALSLLIDAMPDLRLSNPTAVPAWHPTIYFRLLQALPVARCPV
ncbi:hypothetical protein GmRootV59_54430 (plasmid) [Variovorax sp. V59]